MRASITSSMDDWGLEWERIVLFVGTVVLQKVALAVGQDWGAHWEGFQEFGLKQNQRV